MCNLACTCFIPFQRKWFREKIYSEVELRKSTQAQKFKPHQPIGNWSPVHKCLPRHPRGNCRPFSDLNEPMGAFKLKIRTFLVPKVSPGKSLPTPQIKLPFGISRAAADFLSLPSAYSHYCFMSSGGGNSLFPKAEPFPTRSPCSSARNPPDVLLRGSIHSDSCQLPGGPAPTSAPPSVQFIYF